MKLKFVAALGGMKPSIFFKPSANYTMDMPESKIQAVYVDGKRETIGLMGTKASIFLMGQSIMFNDFNFGIGSEIIIEGDKCSYYYKITNDDKDGELNLSLISSIDK